VVDCHDTAAGNPPHTLLKMPTILAGPGAAGEIDRAAGVALLADGAMPHREPAVVDAFDGSAALAGDHAEMADGFAGCHDQPWIRLQYTSTGEHVVHCDFGRQHDRLVVVDLLVNLDDRAVRCVVAERREVGR